MRVKISKQSPPAPTASAVGPCPTVIKIVGRPSIGSLPSTFTPHDHPLSQIYISKSKTLHVKIPRVQQQPSSHDCRLFAIANVIEFCHSPNSFNSKNNFSVSKMRQDLIDYFENGKMTSFPKEKYKDKFPSTAHS